MNEQAIGTTIRKIREQAGITVTSAARSAELTKSTLSKIETGQISPPISTLMRIAKALNVRVVEFFNEERQETPYVFTPHGKGKIITQNGSKFGYAYEALALDKHDKNIEPFILTIDQNDPAGEFRHEGQEFIYMISGSMEVSIGEKKLIVKAGDALYFDSSYVHKTHVLGKRPARFLCIFIQDMKSKK